MLADCFSSRFILVRHGRSTFNDQGRYQGSSDQAVLTPRGVETARQVGESLQEIAIDAVYTSPLLRAKQTTSEILKAMAQKHPKPIMVSGYLREIDLSVWEGLTYDHVRQHHRPMYDCWQQRPDQFKLPAADGMDYFPVNALYERAQKFWTHILSRHGGKTVLVVSHGGTNHALISAALGFSAKNHHSLQQSNCGVSVLEFSGYGVQLTQLNQTAETLPKLKAGKHGIRLLLVAEESLTSAVFEQLMQRLVSIKLDFCLLNRVRQPWLSALMSYYPTIKSFMEERDGSLNDWPMKHAQMLGMTQNLTTGIAIAPTTNIQTLLIQTLGGRPHEGTKLLPGYLSVIHYPKNRRPVVQAINI